MSEAFLSNLSRDITAQVGNLLSQEMRLLFGLEDELDELKNSIFKLRLLLDGAEEPQSKDQNIKNFLMKIKDAMYDADDLIDRFECEALKRKSNNKVCHFFFKANPIGFRLPMAHRINKLRANIDNFFEEICKLNVIERIRVERDEQIRERETHSFILEEEVIGRDDEKNEIREKLFDTDVESNVSVIAIVGIGGSGKTALAQCLYNEHEVKNHFDLKMWVCVSEEFDVKTILGKIIESATERKPTEIQNLDSLQSQMRREIEGKKYLLVMDDIWNENDEKWAALEPLLVGGARGSRIVITTRSERVAEIARPILVVLMQGLSEGDSWLLFEKIAFRKGEGDGANDPDFIEIGKEIVEKLNGVPLAIRTIGRVLYSKTSKSEWESFRDELSTIIQGEEGMMSILKVSYNNLPTHLKPCFTYCSLFPKDFLIDINDLIKQWIAQGFINQSQCQGNSMEDVGIDYFIELYWRSLFQDIQSTSRNGYYVNVFKIHDLLHDLAQSVSGGEHIHFKNSTDVRNIDIKRARHVYFEVEPDINWEIPTSTVEAKKLRSVLLFPSETSRYQCSMEKLAFGMIISYFVHLRVLNLSDLNISVVPKTINKLNQLRYLDLSSNGNIRSLPNSITELKRLETLELSDCCSLQELPKRTSDLVNLRHLGIVGCEIRHMPQGLSKLTCLQTMNLFVLGKKCGSGLNELNALNNLSGELVIKGLEFLRHNKTKARVSRDPKLKEKQGLLSIKLYWENPQTLEVDEVESRVDETVLDNLQLHANIESLRIDGYNGLVLSNWINSLSNLVEITISDCKRLQCLQQLDQLPLLESVDLQFLSRLESIVDISGSASTIFFPSLQSLILYDLPELKRFWMGDQRFPHFPKLNDLRIESCPNLVISNIENEEEMQWKAFESLRSLRVDRLPRLSSLPYGLQYVSTLEKLTLYSCENLEVLPEWIGNFTSLSFLDLRRCKNLKCLPHGIRYLTSLQTLLLYFCHEDLCKRCRRLTGEYWPLIAHIPKVMF